MVYRSAIRPDENPDDPADKQLLNKLINGVYPTMIQNSSQVSWKKRKMNRWQHDAAYRLTKIKVNHNQYTLQVRKGFGETLNPKPPYGLCSEECVLNNGNWLCKCPYVDWNDENQGIQKAYKQTYKQYNILHDFLMSYTFINTRTLNQYQENLKALADKTQDIIEEHGGNFFSIAGLHPELVKCNHFLSRARKFKLSTNKIKVNPKD